MIYLILNNDKSIKEARHESCGIPEGPHVDVDDAAWAVVADYDHTRVRYVDGALVVDDQALKDAANVKIKAQIAKIESGQHRAVREATLTGDRARLQAIEDQIEALRKQLEV